MKTIEFYDDKNKTHTIFLNEYGGPIISDKSLKKARVKFFKALTLYDALLKYFEYEKFIMVR